MASTFCTITQRQLILGSSNLVNTMSLWCHHAALILVETAKGLGHRVRMCFVIRCWLRRDKFRKMQSPDHCLLLPDRPLSNILRTRGHDFELPRCSLNLHRRSFVINCLFKFIDTVCELTFAYVCTASCNLSAFLLCAK